MLVSYLFGLKFAALSGVFFLVGSFLAVHIWECDQIRLKNGAVVGGISGTLAGSLLSLGFESTLRFESYLALEIFCGTVSAICGILCVRFSK